MDVLDEILSSLRLSGGVVIDGEFSGDYCVLAQFTPDHFAPFFPLPETLISYHYVRSGRMLVEVEGHAADRCVEAAASRSCRATTRTCCPAERAAAGGRRARSAGSPPTASIACQSGTDGAKAEVWCGFLGTAQEQRAPAARRACRRC